VKETEVELFLTTEVKRLFGGLSRKWSSPQHNNVEDRIVFLPLGEIWFIEVKRPGKLPTEGQWREIMRQRNLGANAGYLSSTDEVTAFLYSGDRVEWMRQHVQKCPEEWRNVS